MMRVEPCKEYQSINIVLRNDMMTNANKGKQPKEDGWVHKAPEKDVAFELNCAKETFMEEKKSFVDVSTS